MKKYRFFIISILLFGLLANNIVIKAQTWPPEGMQGSGSQYDPWQFTTPSHLEALALYVNIGNGDNTIGKYYKLMNNIDLSGYSQGEGWMPIGRYPNYGDYSKAFQGSFDGNGNLVVNLSIYRPEEDYIGLFGFTNSAEIQNLGIENCTIVGKYLVGGMVGESWQSWGRISIIRYCYVSGSIVGYYCAGGLVGKLSSGTISNCYTIGKVVGTGLQYFGGLVGETAYGLINNCYSTSRVSGGRAVGGLIGNSAYSTNCFTANDSIIASTSTSSIGRVSASCGYSCRNFYAIIDMVVQDSDGDVNINDGLNTKDGKGVAIELLQSLDFYTNATNWDTNYDAELWDVESPTSVWKICDGVSLPFLRWQNKSCNPFTIISSCGSNGTIKPLGEITVLEFESQTFEFYPNTSYRVDSVFIDGIFKPELIGVGSYTFESVEADHSIHVTFKEGVGISENTKLGITVYPNPTTGILSIASSQYSIVRAEIFDVYGRKVLTSDYLLPNTQIDISHLSNGFYFIKATLETGQSVSKPIILQRN